LYGPTAPGLVGPVGARSEVLKSASQTMATIASDDVMHWINDLHTALQDPLGA